MNLTENTRIEGEWFVIAAEWLTACLKLDSSGLYDNGDTGNEPGWYFSRAQILAAITYKEDEPFCYLHTEPIPNFRVYSGDFSKIADRAAYHLSLVILSGGDAQIAKQIISWAIAEKLEREGK